MEHLKRRFIELVETEKRARGVQCISNTKKTGAYPTIRIPEEDSQWLRETVEAEGFSESGILEHALRFLMDEIEAGKRAWSRRT